MLNYYLVYKYRYIYIIYFFFIVAVVMHKDKEENSHRDSHYRAREMAALAAYDHHHLDGEMFLQVRKNWNQNNFHYINKFNNQIYQSLMSLYYFLYINA